MEQLNWQRRLIDPPADYHPQITPWVWALEDTRVRTKESLRGMTQDVLDWIPPQGGNNVGTILYHVAAIEMSYLYEDILGIGWADELEPLLLYDLRDEAGQLIVVQGERLEQHLQRLDATRALLLRTLRTMTPEELRRDRQVEDYVVTPEWILHHLMQHEAEHRGQIGEIRQRAEQALAY